MRALEDVEVSLVGVLIPTEDVDADHVSPGAERVGVVGVVILLVEGGSFCLKGLIMLCLPRLTKYFIAYIKYSNISVEHDIRYPRTRAHTNYIIWPFAQLHRPIQLSDR